LALALLHRKTLPIEEAAHVLSSQQEDVVELAAHILGRAGSQASPHGAKLETAIAIWREKWEQLRSGPPLNPVYHPVQSLTGCLTRLMWAAGRMETAVKELMSAATSHTDDHYFRPIRLEAIRALAHGKASKQILEVLEAAALGHDPEARAVAAQALAEQDAKRAEGLAGKMLSDRVSLERLAFAENLDITEALHSAAENAHSQGVVLPVLIAAGDLEHLKNVACNQALPEAARLGAIEGLALLGQEAAEEELAKLGKNETEDEELRKAAWRARRRSKRLRLQTTGSNS
jgi:ParB family chromosome partitioning protein